MADLFNDAEEQGETLARTLPKSKTESSKAAFSAGIGSGPLQKLLQGGGLVIAKLAGGAVAGVGLAIWYYIRDGKAAAAESLSMKIVFTLVASAMGVGAAAVLIVADAVGKKSNFARWLTLIGLIFAIAIGVVFYFAITGFK